VFTTSNWNKTQTVTVTGVDDAVQDLDQPYAIQLGPSVSNDAAYDAKTPNPILLTNVDDD
jgi:hypothetical protein